jgi:ssDNA-binding Zn-finger/Zn-ribbon topoisomerase 1
MAQKQLRYSGPPTTKYSYMNEFVVICPKCNKDALIKAKPLYLDSGKLQCRNCLYSEKTENLIRYKVIAKRNCDSCGKPIEKIIPVSNEKVEDLAVTCDNCGQTRNMKPKNEEIRLYFNDIGQATDPLFNLPLWFQADVKGEVFWAYNREHLLEIRNYVEAKLRERQTTTHTTMVERLPGFIKSAKNRAQVLKTINNLLKK